MKAWLKRHSLILYFLIAYAVTWSFEIPLALSVQGLIRARVPLWTHYFASFGPLVAAVLVTILTEGRDAVRALVGRIFKWRVNWRYYAFAALIPLALFGLAVILDRVLTGAWPDLSLLGKADYLPDLGPLGVLVLWFLTYGLGEETGWRGYALPHLQSTHRATTSTLILAVLWACWHLPAFFYRDTYMALGLLGFPMFAFSLLFAAMVFTWLYNATRGSILLVIIFHAFFNWLSVSDAGGQYAATIMTIPVIVWAILIPRIYGQENAARLQRQMA
jgi:membrane protease YdiL (CAAX protease family)